MFSHAQTPCALCPWSPRPRRSPSLPLVVACAPLEAHSGLDIDIHTDSPPIHMRSEDIDFRSFHHKPHPTPRHALPDMLPDIRAGPERADPERADPERAGSERAGQRGLVRSGLVRVGWFSLARQTGQTEPDRCVPSDRCVLCGRWRCAHGRVGLVERTPRPWRRSRN